MHRAPATPVLAPLSRFLSGDNAAFGDLVDTYSGPSLAVAFRILHDRDLAEEAVQDAFVRVWQQASKFDPARGSERSWVLAIVRNQAIDLLRRRLRQREQTLDDWLAIDPAGRDHALGTVLEASDAAIIRSALAELPAEQRGTIRLAFFRDMRPVEIARALGIPEGTVRSRLRMGLARMRRLLEPVREDLVAGPS